MVSNFIKTSCNKKGAPSQRALYLQLVLSLITLDQSYCASFAPGGASHARFGAVTFAPAVLTFTFRLAT